LARADKKRGLERRRIQKELYLLASEGTLGLGKRKELCKRALGGLFQRNTEARASGGGGRISKRVGGISQRETRGGRNTKKK